MLLNLRKQITYWVTAQKTVSGPMQKHIHVKLEAHVPLHAGALVSLYGWMTMPG